VAILAHVEIEPVLSMKPRRRAVTAGRVESDQMGAFVAFPQAASHGPQGVEMRLFLDRAVAAEDPDEARFPVAPADPLTVRSRLLRCEDRRLALQRPVFHLSPQVGKKPT
jgi:hypothetical protein